MKEGVTCHGVAQIDGTWTAEADLVNGMSSTDDSTVMIGMRQVTIGTIAAQ